MTLVTVFNGATAAEAQLVRTTLDAAGFHPTIVNEYNAIEMFGGWAATTGGVRVQVPDDEAADAKEFLDTPTAPAE